jgi:cell division septum initiation protein DivIVA
MRTSRATASANPTDSAEASRAAGLSPELSPGQTPVEESVEDLEGALDAARRRLEQRLTDEIEHRHAELDRLRTTAEQLRGEANTIIEQANDSAVRIVAEAKQTEARVLAEVEQKVASMVDRLREGAGSFLERAVMEIGSVQADIAAEGAKATPKTDTGSPAPAPRVESQPEPAAVDPTEERIVTRLIVRPAILAEKRKQFKETVASLPGVDAVLFGADDEDSFEMLIAHQHSATVLDSLTTGTDEIRVTATREGCLELELTGGEWLEGSAKPV